MTVRMRMPGWVGRREREPVALVGSLVFRGGRSIPVRIVDMSPEGCRVECEEALPIGIIVRLELADAVANAQVRWALNGAAGLQIL